MAEPSSAWTPEVQLTPAASSDAHHRALLPEAATRSRLLEEGLRFDAEAVLPQDNSDTEVDPFLTAAKPKKRGRKAAPRIAARDNGHGAARPPPPNPWGTLHRDAVHASLQFVATSVLTAPQAMYDNALLHMFYAQTAVLAQDFKWVGRGSLQWLRTSHCAVWER